jgi:hypothetical protein
MKTQIPLLLLLSVLLAGASQANSNRIQVGYCAKLSEIDAAKAAGFDYIELSTSEIVALSDSDFDKLVGKLKELKLPVPVT